MTIDYKTAKHICNVVRRQVKTALPDLHLHFVLHQENKRQDSLALETGNIEEHPAGKVALEHLKNDDTTEILTQNRSCLATMSHHHNPGFLGFFKQNSFIAVCFINYERFSNEEYLKNHALNIAWHGISLYNDRTKTKSSKTSPPDLTDEQKHQRNLTADIFSASVQTLQGKESALKTLATQRIHSAITAEKGFVAENYPFPVCLDTLEFIFKNNLEPYEKNKKPILSAKKLTEDSSRMFDEASIQQWRSFSLPAQEMAWYGHSPAVILGAAIYTSENTYAQSIADMIAERMEIKPESLTSFSGYNPFTAAEANERIHKKLCKDLIQNILPQTFKRKDYKVFIDLAEKQNEYIQNNHAIGWCAPALISAAQIIVHEYKENETPADFHKRIEEAFTQEIERMPWTTLQFFSRSLFMKRRNGIEIDKEELENTAAEEEEFLSIYNGLIGIRLFKDGIKAIDFETPTQEKQSIIDFISSNAIKE